MHDNNANDERVAFILQSAKIKLLHDTTKFHDIFLKPIERNLDLNQFTTLLTEFAEFENNTAPDSSQERGRKLNSSIFTYHLLLTQVSHP